MKTASLEGILIHHYSASLTYDYPIVSGIRPCGPALHNDGKYPHLVTKLRGKLPKNYST
jgi:hypothetical protein